MTSITIFDAEADGLLDTASKVWCICSTDYNNPCMSVSKMDSFGPRSIQKGLDHLSNSDVIVGHNIIEYDLRLFKMLWDWEPSDDQLIVDTLVYSRMLYPKRPKPSGYEGKSTHSIEAWGHRVGMAKPEHEDWSQYSPEMLVRCKRDVMINYLLLKELEEETDEESFFYQTWNQ